MSRSKYDSPEWNRGNKEMKPPKKGKKPKKIETENPPGGPKTPGEKGTYDTGK